MPIAAKLDEFGKPAWIALMILGFMAWWPLGFFVLAFILGSGRMGCWNHNGASRWQSKMDRMRSRMERRSDFWGGSSSGNYAFDEYRSETLRRLEDEQREFREFLERLRFAKDRDEFDQFMAERRNRQQTDRPPTDRPQNDRPHA
jgi:hypothetical protein